MTALAHPRAHVCVVLEATDDFDEWRHAARRLVQAGMPPAQVSWQEPDGVVQLFSHDTVASLHVPENAQEVRVSRGFLRLARSTILHSDPARFDLLYHLLWDHQHSPRVMEDAAHPVLRRLQDFDRQVRRDIHKMRAFLRFRHVPPGDEPEAGERYVAWFEPEHHILRANAAFFTGRFANMRWSILTPRGTLHWDGEVLEEGPPACRDDAPGGDPLEDLWRRYYASIFNPARLKVGAMVKEMPRKYWKNMPEAELIPDLIAGAQAREARMVAAGEQAEEPRPASLGQLARGIAACTRCPIHCLGTGAVAGEGDPRASLMIVGEQPGDHEDQQGRPFVGPAGQVLRSHLHAAQIDVRQAWLTNAVKHFKFTLRGKKRLHQTPAAKEVDSCRWWLESERALVQPRIVLALGASAARGMLGRTISIARERGRPIALEDGSELWITAHPSYLLRLDGAAAEEQERLFAADLAAVRARLTELGG